MKPLKLTKNTMQDYRDKHIEALWFLLRTSDVFERIGNTDMTHFPRLIEIQVEQTIESNLN